MARKIPDALIAHAAKLIKGGANLKNAAMAIGCNPDELSKKLRAIGVSNIDKRRDWKALTGKIVELYANGMGSTAIAAHLGAPRHAASNVRSILISAGLMRGHREAGNARFEKASAVEKKSIISKARQTRMRNLIQAAESKTESRAIGFGEKELADILEDAGLPVRRQVVVNDNYLIDIAIGNVAVEIKTSALSAHVSKFNGTRFKKIADHGFSILFIVVNHIETIVKHADDLIGVVKIAQSDPTSRGEYRVVRCTLEQIGADTDVDHWSVERRTPKPGRERF